MNNNKINLKCISFILITASQQHKQLISEAPATIKYYQLFSCDE